MNKHKLVYGKDYTNRESDAIRWAFSLFSENSIVYFPLYGGGLHRIVKQSDGDGFVARSLGSGKTHPVLLDVNGLELNNTCALTPLIFHATDENRELLTKLYKFDFEERISISKVLEETGGVCCVVRDYAEPTDVSNVVKQCLRIVKTYKEHERRPFCTTDGVMYTYAKPVTIDAFGVATPLTFEEVLWLWRDKQQK